jgi:hypothetical protein
MSDPFFFGYGSLVNRATHSYLNARPAAVTGWRRVWRHTILRPVAFLTVEPAPGIEIEGLAAEVPGGDWIALDRREAAYDRVPVEVSATPPLPEGAEVAIYSIPAGHHADPSTAHPVLLSYLDVVLQGYFREFGPAGVQRFVATTGGWDVPVLNDRAHPRYPRHQALTVAERALVDETLADLPIRLIAT